MKICWDNIENLRLSVHGNFRITPKTYRYFDACIECGEPYLGVENSEYCSWKCRNKSEKFKQLCSGENSPMYGRTGENSPMYGRTGKNHPAYGRTGKNSPSWKGGYGGVPRYDTFVSKLELYEECRRNMDDPNVLEVKCTYCGKWHVPKVTDVGNRITGINKNGGYRFYCSAGCKQECPIYKRIKYYKGQKGYNSREVQPQLRQLVFARDNWTCQKCGCTEHLHCHHIDPVANNPIESADIDNCITLCKQCHKEAHKQPGCGYSELSACG